MRYLVGEDTDVIHVNCGSGMTTAHFVSLMQDWGGHVFAFGAKNNVSVMQNMDRLGVKGRQSVFICRYVFLWFGQFHLYDVMIHVYHAKNQGDAIMTS